MSYIIEPRDGAEVYVGSKGHVCIKQEVWGGDDQVINLHPDEIPQLIEYLQTVRQEALEFVPEPESDEQKV